MEGDFQTQLFIIRQQEGIFFLQSNYIVNLGSIWRGRCWTKDKS